MKKFILFVAGLVFAFAVINVCYLWVLSIIDWNFGKTKEAFGFKDESYKILVFGNSTALDGINTEMISRNVGKAYNFAIGGASLETNYIQLLDYMENNRPPEKVLLFLSSCHLDYNRQQEVNPIIQFFSKKSPEFTGLHDLPLFKFRWLFIEDFKLLLSKQHRSAEVVNGQLRMDKTIADITEKLKSPESGCYTNTDYREKGYDFLLKMIDVCQRNAIEVLVFEMPCWKKYQNNCLEVTLDMERPVRVHNLNQVSICDSVLNSQTDWLSENHLNFSGSNKLTKVVLSIIKDDFVVDIE